MSSNNPQPETQHEGGASGQRQRAAIVILTSVIVLALAAWVLITAQRGSVTEVPISEFAQRVSAGEIQSITVAGEDVRSQIGEDVTIRSRKEPGVGLTETLQRYGVPDARIAELTVDVEATGWPGWLTALIWIAPVGLIILFMVGLSRTQRAGAGDMGQIGGFLRSRARHITVDRPLIQFSDVAGVDAAKEELQEVVEFLRDPRRFTALGAHVPRGVLLVGPPGTGKTLLAKAVAGEARVAFFSVNASEFVEMFVGVGASRARDLFRQARESSPSIVFIDEIDAIGRRRGSGVGQSHEEREQTLNQILAELDGFDERERVVIMAATNRPDVLDSALLRPGRFDRRVSIDAPDRDGRLAILQIHARGKPLASDVDLEDVARSTVGFSGADLENLLNEAALLAAREHKSRIGRAELDEAAQRVVTGPQRRGRPLGPWEQKLVAYHEAGHAVTAHYLPNADPVQRVSVVGRGASGGHTMVLPDEDRRFWTRGQLHDTLAYTLGGMVAEELIFGESTTGPGSDLERASNLARKMVLEYGMSDEFGPVAVRSDQANQPFEGPMISQETAATVDAEVRRLVSEARDQAQETLAERRSELDRLAAALKERETLHREDIDQLLGPPLHAHRPLDGGAPTEAAAVDYVPDPTRHEDPIHLQNEPRP